MSGTGVRIVLSSYVLAMPCLSVTEAHRIVLRCCYAMSRTEIGPAYAPTPSLCHALLGEGAVSYTHLRAHETEADL
eukprot:1028299-Rhodomonas_salina.1